MPRSSESVAALASALAKAQAELINPEKSLTATIRTGRLGEGERSFRYAPLSSGEDTTDRVSPKAGFIWTPAFGTTVRGAYSRSISGVSFDQSFQLEPCHQSSMNILTGCTRIGLGVLAGPILFLLASTI
jgi:hypothetical protein